VRRPRGGARGAGALGRDEVDGLPPLCRARAPASALSAAAVTKEDAAGAAARADRRPPAPVADAHQDADARAPHAAVVCLDVLRGRRQPVGGARPRGT
jgi:hypothetical protein